VIVICEPAPAYAGGSFAWVAADAMYGRGSGFPAAAPQVPRRGPGADVRSLAWMSSPDLAVPSVRCFAIPIVKI
jgi:hypothetical protein